MKGTSLYGKFLSFRTVDRWNLEKDEASKTCFTFILCVEFHSHTKWYNYKGSLSKWPLGAGKSSGRMPIMFDTHHKLGTTGVDIGQLFRRVPLEQVTPLLCWSQCLSNALSLRVSKLGAAGAITQLAPWLRDKGGRGYPSTLTKWHHRHSAFI